MSLAGFMMFLSIGVLSLLLAASLVWWLASSWRQRRFKAVAFQSVSILVLSAVPLVLFTLLTYLHILGLQQDPAFANDPAMIGHERDKAKWTWAFFVISYGLFISAAVITAVVFLARALAKFIISPAQTPTQG